MKCNVKMFLSMHQAAFGTRALVCMYGMYVCTYVYVCMYVFMYVCMNVCMYVCDAM